MTKGVTPFMFTMRKRPAVLLTAGTLLTAFSLAGCSNNTPDAPPTVVTTTAPSPAPAATTSPATSAVTAPPGPNTKINVNAGPGSSQGTDEATGEAVNKAIVTNKEMTGARVEAVVTSGVATLTGSVQDAQQKALAEKAAHDTPGVSSVKNKLQINPTGGAKSPSGPPVTKTKIVVIHDKSPASSAPPAAPATPEQPSGPSDGTGTSPSTPPADNGSAPGTATPPATGTGQ